MMIESTTDLKSQSLTYLAIWKMRTSSRRALIKRAYLLPIIYLRSYLICLFV